MMLGDVTEASSTNVEDSAESEAEYFLGGHDGQRWEDRQPHWNANKQASKQTSKKQINK